MDVKYRIDNTYIDEDLENFPVMVHIKPSNMLEVDFDSLFVSEKTTWISGNVLTVGAGKDYTTIQAAVNAANAGDEILIDAGTYNEIVTITKQVHMRGLGATPSDVLIITSGTNDATLLFSGISSFVSSRRILTFENIKIKHTYNWRSAVAFNSSFDGGAGTEIIFNGCIIEHVNTGVCIGFTLRPYAIVRLINTTLNKGYADIASYSGEGSELHFTKCFLNSAYSCTSCALTPLTTDYVVATATYGYGPGYYTEFGGEITAFNIKDENNNPCYSEIVWQNYDNKELVFYTKLPIVYSDNYTYFGFITGSGYDPNYTGTTGSEAAQNVWDDNYVAVYHMEQDPSIGPNTILDSTTNRINGTFSGSMTSDDLVDGLITNAISFDSIDDYVELDTIPITSTWTAEIMLNASSTKSGDGFIVFDGRGIVQSNGFWSLLSDNNVYVSGSSVADSVWVYLASSYDGSTSYRIYEDGVETSSTTSGDGWALSDQYYIARGYNSYLPQALIDEVRVSNVERSPAWIKATSNSLRANLVKRVYPTHCAGFVNDINSIVRLYRRSDGFLIGETTPNPDGSFSIQSLFVEDHYIIALNNSDTHNALIYDYITPSEDSEI